jgi:predicted O-methyltransferase YrrM
MFSRLQLAKKYILYYLNAHNGKGHGIHSPFVFRFVKDVLNDTTGYATYNTIESLRRELLHDSRVIQVEDMGAGSVKSKTRQRKVAEIARHAAKPKKFGQLLFRMVQYYQPETILELGTSLGITTCYLASGSFAARIITLEGARAIADIARININRKGLRNVQLVEGNFDDTLKWSLNEMEKLDFAFIDGNHRKEPTLRYFHELSGKIHTGSILIFDDIHWSMEMEEAWQIIRADASVTLSIDLFFIGIVFFRNDFKSKQHFIIHF